MQISIFSSSQKWDRLSFQLVYFSRRISVNSKFMFSTTKWWKYKILCIIYHRWWYIAPDLKKNMGMVARQRTLLFNYVGMQFGCTRMRTSAFLCSQLCDVFPPRMWNNNYIFLFSTLQYIFPKNVKHIGCYTGIQIKK